MKTFEATAEYNVKTGDVLYLPPGVPHWGVADELCMTMSIGCRAPTKRELELGRERVLELPAAESVDDDRSDDKVDKSEGKDADSLSPREDDSIQKASVSIPEAFEIQAEHLVLWLNTCLRLRQALSVPYPC